jgi:hypothetical protein
MHRLVKPLTDKALFMNGEFMMIFGCGDVAIADQCNKEGDPSRLSFSRLGSEFELPHVGSGPLIVDQESAMFALTGSFQYSVQEIEVFQVNIKAAANPQNHVTPGSDDMETP